MIGLGRALTVESATPGAIADVRRAWEAAPASSCVEGAPSPVLFASFAFRSPARSVGGRWWAEAIIDSAPAEGAPSSSPCGTDAVAQPPGRVSQLPAALGQTPLSHQVQLLGEDPP